MKEGIAAGAVGFSINRFAGHRDTSSVLVPGTLADVDEILMIGKAVAEVPPPFPPLHWRRHAAPGLEPEHAATLPDTNALRRREAEGAV